MEENRIIIGILILFVGLIAFYYLFGQYMFAGEAIQVNQIPSTGLGTSVVGGPSAGNIVLPTISLDCADTNNCFWSRTFDGFYDYLDNNFLIKYELTGNNTIHSHNQYLLITDYVDTNCSVLGSCSNVVYDGDNVSRLFNDAGYLTNEVDPVFTGWLATYTGIVDTNFETAGYDFGDYWKSDGSSTATGDWDIGDYSLDGNEFYANVIWADENRGYGIMYCTDGNIVIGYLEGFTC